MTEAEWQECDDPVKMLELVAARTSARKLRLIACAAWRAGLDPAQPYMAVADMAERWADGLANRKNILALEVPGYRLSDQWILVQEDPVVSARRAVTTSRDRFDPPRVVVIRDIIGPILPLVFPHPCSLCAARGCPACAGTGSSTSPTFPQVWLTPDVRRMAEAAYAERCRDSQRLAILADALEEAGCAQGAVLEHLRLQEPHVPGCWVVDLLLGKG